MRDVEEGWTEGEEQQEVGVVARGGGVAVGEAGYESLLV